MNSIPSDLTTWIDRFLGLYSEAVAAREDQLIRGDDPDALPPRSPRRPPRLPEVEFRPKSSADYIAHISAQEQVRTRAHERLIDRVGRYLVARGYRPNTRVHPIDLEAISQDGPPILIEVKYFPAGHPRVHVREAIGQLYEYRHFLRNPDQPLAAVLSENPGDAYVDLLSCLGIAVMWPNGSSWEGNKHAYALGLTDPE